jgi:glutamate-1-semialdehyde 2,1-aminomutase
LALTWTGTGRLTFSLNYTEADFTAVMERFIAAAKAMRDDGWWWSNPALTNKAIKRTVLREMLMHRLFPPRGPSSH